MDSIVGVLSVIFHPLSRLVLFLVFRFFFLFSGCLQPVSLPSMPRKQQTGDYCFKACNNWKWMAGFIKDALFLCPPKMLLTAALPSQWSEGERPSTYSSITVGVTGPVSARYVMQGINLYLYFIYEPGGSGYNLQGLAKTEQIFCVSDWRNCHMLHNLPYDLPAALICGSMTHIMLNSKTSQSRLQSTCWK